MITHKDDVYFLPLGGSGEIGMNLNLYHDQGQWLMVDCGITFTDTPGLEVVMPDTSFIEERSQDLIGLVLTHAHEDHYGAVPYIWQKLKCPIYCTPFTAKMLKFKCKEAGINPPIHIIPLSGKVEIGVFSIEFITLTHSIPEPNALAIETSQGTILHTGDWKLDPDPLIGEVTDIEALKRKGDKGILALVCDSTNVFVPGRAGSEATARAALVDLIAKYPKSRVVVACFASNVARVKSVYDAAKANGRHVALAGRSLLKIDEAARAVGYFGDVLPFHSSEDFATFPKSQALLISTGSQGEFRAALARIARGEDRNIQLEAGDVVIFSSRQIPGNEEAISSLQNKLVQLGVIVLTADDEDIHVSGHPCRDDLIDMYQWTRPKVLIPVHGEQRHMREQAKLGRECQIPQTIVPSNGTLIRLKNGHAEIVDEIEVGRLALDGTQIIPMFGDMMRDRHKMMTAGHAVITLVFRDNGQLAAEPLVLLTGIVSDEAEPQLRNECIEIIEKTLFQAPAHLVYDEERLGEAMRVAVRRVLEGYSGKKAPTQVQILRVS
jgi:ribonuclease J